jgi:hypothetical protein
VAFGHAAQFSEESEPIWFVFWQHICCNLSIEKNFKAAIVYDAACHVAVVAATVLVSVDKVKESSCFWIYRGIAIFVTHVDFGETISQLEK